MDKRKQRLLLIGAVLLLLGGVYRFYPVLHGFLPNASEIETRQDRLVQYQKQLAKLRAMKDRLEQLKKALNRVESKLFAGDTPSLAAVEIQKMLSEISGNSGAQIESIEVLSVKPLEQLPYVEIPIRFVILARIDQLKHILYGIESHDRFLAVKEARIKPRRIHQGEDGVQAVLTVAGLMKKKS